MSKKTMQPLKEFICDKCKMTISSHAEGYVEYLFSIDDKRPIDTGHKILHRGCEFYKNQLQGTIELQEFAGTDAVGESVKRLEENLYGEPNEKIITAQELRDYLTFIKRISIPYFEEARQYFEDAEEDGLLSELKGLIYSAENLRKIINTYSPTLIEN